MLKASFTGNLWPHTLAETKLGSLEVQIQELEVQAAIKRQEEEKEEKRLRMEEEEQLRGTQFTCFTGAKVPLLPFTCFTGTNVQILRQHRGGSRYSV